MPAKQTEMESGMTFGQRLPSEDEIRDLSIARAMELAQSTDWRLLLDRPNRHEARMALRNLLAYDANEVVAATAQSALISERYEYVVELCAAVAEEGPDVAEVIRQAVLAARLELGEAVSDRVDAVAEEPSPAARAGASVVQGWLADAAQ